MAGRRARRPLPIRAAGLSEARTALDELDRVVADVAARLALGRRRPTSREVRAAAEEVIREAVNATTMALDVLNARPGVPLTTTALRHLSGVQRTARRMIDQAQRLGIDPRQLRADLADLLRGAVIDHARYELAPKDLTGLRSVRADMERLMVDQIQDATFEAEWADLWVQGVVMVDWNRSGEGGRPCVCDELAAESPYPVEAVPQRPHPYCQCFLTPHVET